MAGLDPAIHISGRALCGPWMGGSRPPMVRVSYCLPGAFRSFTLCPLRQLLLNNRNQDLLGNSSLTVSGRIAFAPSNITSSGSSSSKTCGETSLEAAALALISLASNSIGISARINSIPSGARPPAFSFSQASYILFSVSTKNFCAGFSTMRRKSISDRNFIILPTAYLPLEVFALLVEIDAIIFLSVLTASKSNTPPLESFTRVR